MKSIAVLGSTGSIGENALVIARMHPGQFKVRVLAARKNIKRLAEQAHEFRPDYVAIYDASLASQLRREVAPLGLQVLEGEKGICEAVQIPDLDLVISAMVGARGILPLFCAIRAGKNVAVANKEPLVMAGKLVMEEAAKQGAQVLPIDSEHSGLWQLLEGKEKGTIQKLILTSSGGPFFKWAGDFETITPEQALRHPKWKMGPKITIDSATLMNKGLEVIEASNLFGIPPERLEVLIHPEAIVHALIEFVDGSHLAHLSVTDMKLPIQYAMSYPGRLSNGCPRLDLAALEKFTFFAPDLEHFPCLRLGFEAAHADGTLPAVLNAANEVAAELFLKGKITFTDIPRVVEKVMSLHRLISSPTLSNILEADEWAREEALRFADLARVSL
ncbi:MAG: 1-deoxy-D-xylulose-5-phosphate reductoisomerase [Candidatus Omnitrophica bacterium]|nr:1-deoxy-D-xylulose-5-phosphate reductoisomerase [Candidatus Omnitrophota bacterium]